MLGEIMKNLNWSIIISSLVTILVAIIGWSISYYITNNQIQKSKQKEVITGYLVEAYRQIEDVCARDSLTNDQKRNVEKAVADIQLFGTRNQIKLTKNFTEEMNKNSESDPRKLLIVLRNDLRIELGIEPASTDFNDIIHWRLK
jgi:hypothetical protein